MYKILFSFGFIVFFHTLSISASVKHYFDIIPDSLFENKDNAVIVKDTADYLMADLSTALTIQLKVMTKSDGDSCICLIKTYKAPEENSIVEFYDMEWNNLAKDISLSRYFDDMKNTIKESKINPLLISARLSPSSETIALKVSDFMLSDDEKKEIDSTLFFKEVELRTVYSDNSK